MRSVSISAEKQPDVQIVARDSARELWVRQNAEEITIETEGGQEGTAWTCDEAYMQLDPEDCPTVEEVEEDIETWFDYAAAWEPERTKTNAELQADIEYIALMAGIDLGV